MSIRQWALAPLALLLTVGVHAQTAAPAKSDAKADPKAEAAAAAMERAKRMAAGPMRVILEASKGKRVPAEAVAAPAADSNSVRTVATRAAVVPEAAARAAPAAQVNAAETVPAPAATAPAPAPTANAVTTQITLNSESLQGQSVANVPSIERAASAAAAVMPNLPAAPMVLPKVADALVKPKLINRVDPELSQRLLDDLGRNAVVSVDLSLRADGSVAGVVFVTSVSTRVQRAVAAALEQWRFEPLASDRVHRVELIFSGE